jgi:hypothetical protein
MAGLEPLTVIFALIGVAVAVGLAIVAGTITARIFFDATREPNE